MSAVWDSYCIPGTQVNIFYLMLFRVFLLPLANQNLKFVFGKKKFFFNSPFISLFLFFLFFFIIKRDMNLWNSDAFYYKKLFENVPGVPC